MKLSVQYNPMRVVSIWRSSLSNLHAEHYNFVCDGWNFVTETTSNFAILLQCEHDLKWY